MNGYKVCSENAPLAEGWLESKVLPCPRLVRPRWPLGETCPSLDQTVGKCLLHNGGQQSWSLSLKLKLDLRAPVHYLCVHHNPCCPDRQTVRILSWSRYT